VKRITIKIAEGIRVAPYEVIKPEIAMEFDVPDDVDLEKFYREKYKEVKRIWNLHLYNLLFNTDARQKANNVFDYATELVKFNEKFPTFVFKDKEKKDGDS